MSRSPISFNSYTNGNPVQKTTGNTYGVVHNHIANETSREGHSGDYGGSNGTLSAPSNMEERHGSARRGSDVDMSDTYGRLRADRRALNISTNSKYERTDVSDLKSSGYGRGPGARQIEGQQLLRRIF